MEERAEGIILRTRPLSDTSLIVKWITAEQGIISTVAKGARRPKSPYSGKLDLFFAGQFSFVRSRRSELHTLHEISIRETHARLRTSLPLLHQAAWFTILLESATERDTPIPEIYSILQEYLRHLPQGDRTAEAMFLFEFKVLNALGFEPDLADTALSDEARHLLASDFEQLPHVIREGKNQLNRLLRAAIIFALDRLPPQRDQAIQSIIAAK
jgi:DNA repair protein RecO (recombination protein O)